MHWTMRSYLQKSLCLESTSEKLARLLNTTHTQSCLQHVHRMSHGKCRTFKEMFKNAQAPRCLVEPEVPQIGAYTTSPHF